MEHMQNIDRAFCFICFKRTGTKVWLEAMDNHFTCPNVDEKDKKSDLSHYCIPIKTSPANVLAALFAEAIEEAEIFRFDNYCISVFNDLVEVEKESCFDDSLKPKIKYTMVGTINGKFREAIRMNPTKEFIEQLLENSNILT